METLNANHSGLSPPTRGNPSKSGNVLTVVGSIPAHAGEPRLREKPKSIVEVYPRPRGGTESVFVDSA